MCIIKEKRSRTGIAFIYYFFMWEKWSLLTWPLHCQTLMSLCESLQLLEYQTFHLYLKCLYWCEQSKQKKLSLSFYRLLHVSSICISLLLASEHKWSMYVSCAQDTCTCMAIDKFTVRVVKRTMYLASWKNKNASRFTILASCPVIDGIPQILIKKGMANAF